MMNAMMEETLLTGTAHKAELPGWQAAGKTGTSQDWRDAWFVGYTSALVAGVWLGNDDGSPTKKVSGGNLPVEIWSRFMKAAHQGVPRGGAAVRRLAQWRPAGADAPPAAPPDAGRRAAGDRPAGAERRRAAGADCRRASPDRPPPTRRAAAARRHSQRRRRRARAARAARPELHREAARRRLSGGRRQRSDGGTLLRVLGEGRGK